MNEIKPTIRYAFGQCALGIVLVAQSAQGICAIAMGDDAKHLSHALQQQFPGAAQVDNDLELTDSAARVARFIDNPTARFDLPLDIRGTAFQQKVWQALREIPAGKTASYTDIAQRIGGPKSVRAVAQACAANKLAVVIPCHRVLRSDGGLSGYRWGVERKKALLEREKRLSGS